MTRPRPSASSHLVDGRHLVLVGINFTHRRATGDKNFWATLLPGLTAAIERITVISVRPSASPRERVTLDGHEIEVRYVAPTAVGSTGLSVFGRRILSWRGGSHPRMIGLLAKQLVTRRIVAELADVLGDSPGAHVHLMDNFGPANLVLTWVARRSSACISVTAIAYERRGRRAYDWFLRLSYRVPGLRVVPMSRAFARRLAELGVPSRSIHRIPWGVHPVDVVTDEARAAARGRLGLSCDRPLVLWAGFIQQVREPDFWLAHGIASESRDAGLDATFLFAFKPETFADRYARLDRPDEGIVVIPTAAEVFTDARLAADLLLSPIEDRDCIVAPPLTWIECMANGLPVLTTDVPGAEELVEDGRTGYRVTSRDELVAAVATLCREAPELRASCQAKVAAEYDLADIQEAYLDLWFGAR